MDVLEHQYNYRGNYLVTCTYSCCAPDRFAARTAIEARGFYGEKRVIFKISMWPHK